MNKATPHQEEKISQVMHILEESNRVCFTGSAGVGKTWAVDDLLKRLEGTKHTYRRVICAAPTHKALAVLKGKITSKVTFRTIHSILCYKKHTDNSNGKITFKPMPDEKNPPLKGVSLLILDEASMIDTEMLIFLEKYGSNCAIIFIGDNKQINPVGELESPVFLGAPTLFDTEDEAIHHTISNLPGTDRSGDIYYPKYNDQYVGFKPYPNVELTEIIRQGAGNPIVTLSRNIQAIWEYQTRLNAEDKGFVYTTNEVKIIEELAMVNGTDDLKYLAYSNAEVDKINLAVRKRIYGEVPKKIEPQETIVFNAPYKDYVTNQELKVDTVDIDTIEFKVPMSRSKNGVITRTVPLKCYIINGNKSDDWGDGVETWKGIFVIHEQSEAQFKQLTITLARNCSSKQLDYVTRNDFLDNFAEFKYNHAITIHKSQGSTYKRVILNVGSVKYNPIEKEKARLYYTAITRASNLLILYNV